MFKFGLFTGLSLGLLASAQSRAANATLETKHTHLTIVPFNAKTASSFGVDYARTLATIATHLGLNDLSSFQIQFRPGSEEIDIADFAGHILTIRLDDMDRAQPNFTDIE